MCGGLDRHFIWDEGPTHCSTLPCGAKHLACQSSPCLTEARAVLAELCVSLAGHGLAEEDAGCLWALL